MSALKRETIETKKSALIHNASRSVTLLSNMFVSLLDLSRLDSGIIEPNFQVIGTPDLLDPLLQEFESRVIDKGIQFQAHIEEHLLRTDQILFQRVIRNLLGNALDYSDDGHKLDIMRDPQSTKKYDMNAGQCATVTRAFRAQAERRDVVS